MDINNKAGELFQTIDMKESKLTLTHPWVLFHYATNN